jgi:hypothetical protein
VICAAFAADLSMLFIEVPFLERFERGRPGRPRRRLGKSPQRFRPTEPRFLAANASQ